MNLRPYQTDLIKNVCTEWGTHTNVALQSATGSGKTEIAMTLIESSGAQVWFVVHRKELVKQVSKVLTARGIEHGHIAAGYKYQPWHRVYVCMIQTLAAKTTWPDKLPELVICDEAHHCSSKSYDRLFDTLVGKKVLGLTATPKRLDGKPLKNRFTALVEGPTIIELIEQGYLAIPEVYVPPKTAQLVQEHRGQWATVAGDYNKRDISNFFSNHEKVIFGDVIGQWRLIANGLLTLFFCSSVAQAYELAELFTQNGIPSAAIEGNLTDTQRDIKINKFKNREILCLMSCDLIGEGFDVPDCEAVGLLRITKSVAIYLQQIGRVLRITDTKHTCKIIDYVDNMAHFGPPWIKRHWSLEGYGTRKIHDTLTGANLKLCLKCGNYVDSSSLICKHCGNPFKSNIKAFKVIYEDLQKVTIESAQKLIEQQCQKILDRERRKMEVRDKAYYLQKFIEWKVEGETPDAFAERKLKDDAANKEIWKNGTRDQLIDMYSKNKKIDSPTAKADEVLAKREEFKKNQSNPVFDSGTEAEILAFIEADPKYAHIEHKAGYARKIFSGRLSAVFAQGTPEQVAQAKEHVSGATLNVASTAPAAVSAQDAPKKDRFDSMFEFAKSGKMKAEDGTPKVLSDEEAEKFARNVVLKDLKVDALSTDAEVLRKVANSARVKNVDAWVEAKLQENIKKAAVPVNG